MRSIVGLITSSVMNSDSITMICGGGTDDVPIACFKRPSAMEMRRKQVVISMMDGASVTTVRRTSTLTAAESPPAGLEPDDASTTLHRSPGEKKGRSPSHRREH